MAKGAETLGLHTVGDLLEHLPRDRREARTIAALQLDEVATIVVEVRSITSRPVRRRGMKPLVEAVVADATGVMKATFFNQPWLVGRYPAGTRLILGGRTRRATGSPSSRTRRRARASGPTRARWPSTRRPRGSPARRSSNSPVAIGRPPTTRSTRCQPGC